VDRGRPTRAPPCWRATPIRETRRALAGTFARLSWLAALGGCHPETREGPAPEPVARAPAGAQDEPAVCVPRLDLDAAGLFGQGAIWPHPGAPPRELPARERIVDGTLVLKDGEALVLQVAGRLTGKAQVRTDALDDGGTLRIFALWNLFDDLPRTRGLKDEFLGRLGNLLRTLPVPRRSFDAPPATDLENDPNGIGFFVTLESPLHGELRVARVRFDELVPAQPLRHSVGGETRPAAPVAAGTTRRFELPAAPAGATVELALGLPDRLVRQRAPLRATVTAAGSSEGTATLRFEERDASAPPRRFEDVVFHYPEARREPTVVEVALEAGVAGGAPTAVLAAVPKLLPRREAATPWNVLLLSVDTLRADRLFDAAGAGGAGGLTPNLARLARESVRFTRCFSPANFTVPGHASIMTGLQPVVHGANRIDERVSIRRWPSLAGQLEAAGAFTAAFSGGGFVDPAFGFDEHFDRYGTLDPLMSPRNPRYDAGPLRHEEAANRQLREAMSFSRVADWLAAHADRRFFLFLHTYFAHDYWPSPAFARARGADAEGPWPRPLDLPSSEFGKVVAGSPQLDWYRALYDAAVSEADAALEPLLARLRESGLLESTIVVVVADHGEAFREHGTLFHANGLHDEVLHVPLLVRVPGIAPATIDAPVSLIDLAPTLLELTGAAPLDEAQGVSLVPLLRGGEPPDRVLLSQDCPPAGKSANGARVEVTHSALIGSRFKLIRIVGEDATTDALYDLLADPGETHDLAKDPHFAGALASARSSLEHLLGAMQKAADRAKARQESAAPNAGLDDDLHRLGY